MANLALMGNRFDESERLYKKAIPLLEQGGNNPSLVQFLKNYSVLLHRTNNTREAARIDAQLKTMGAN
jgi:hypothetical protein